MRLFDTHAHIGLINEDPIEQLIIVQEAEQEDVQKIINISNNLRDFFRKTARRRVAKDRTNSLGGKVFEAPVALIGKQVKLLFHDEEPDRVEITVQGKSFGMATPVKLNVNCRVKRDKYRHIELQTPRTTRHYTGGSLWGKGEDS